MSAHHHHHNDHDHDHAHDHGHSHGGWGAVRGLFAPHSHDAADSLDSALESSAAGIRAVKISLLVLALTTVVQIAIVAASGSVALAADTIHNFSDALTAVPLWIAFALGAKAATRRYTYGFGRVEDLAGLFVVGMITLSAVGARAAPRRYTYGFGRVEDLAGLFVVGMITLSAVIAGYEAIRRLIHPQVIDHVGWVALAGLVGFLGNETVAVYRIRVGREIGSAALVADGIHARTDGFTSLAVVLGAGGVALGYPLADPIVGLIITVAILAVLRTAVRDVFRRLLDGVDPALVDTAEQSLAAEPGVRSVHSVRMRWLGHRLHADVELDLDPELSLAQAHQIAHDAEHRLVHAVPKLTTALIHAYPAR
ncbi:cation diffusion facilitator family transporter [Mycolicibacterium mucogenicum]|uniref:cation diffusion facilitator family transporter n=1 Tax=Mycolicibacterium mucogenicum TaxID=56689 RepID=UPI0006B36F5C|nr:cation diffusion facilitator family transporter [Mycolicibacterium mucogenicum]